MNNRHSKVLLPSVFSFYRQALRTIRRFPSFDQRQIYYDLLRLKFTEQARQRDPAQIKRLLSSAHEELDWLKSVLDRKADGGAGGGH